MLKQAELAAQLANNLSVVLGQLEAAELKIADLERQLAEAAAKGSE